MNFIKGEGLGVVRKLDSLGRVVIPKEIRREYGLEKGSTVEIKAKDGVILINKYIRPENKTVTKRQVLEALDGLEDVDHKVVDAMLELFE